MVIVPPEEEMNDCFECVQEQFLNTTLFGPPSLSPSPHPHAAEYKYFFKDSLKKIPFDVEKTPQTSYFVLFTQPLF